MNVLYLSYDGLTDPLGQSQILPYLIRLSSQGYNFTIISCEKKNRFLENRDLIQTICEKNNIKWIPLNYTKKPPIISTLIDVIKLKRKALQLHSQHQFKIVHCRSYITSLVGLHFKKKLNVKFIFDMRGFWADERVDGNLWNTKKIVFKKVYAFFKKKEKAFLANADQVISLTYSGKNEMLTWNIPQLKPEKIVIIPCAADFNHFSLTDKNQKTIAKNNLGIPSNDFVLSYLGSIGTWYLLDEMLHFFSELKKEKKDAKFLFLTPEEPAYIYKKASQFGLEEYDFIIRFAQREEIPKYIKASDFSLFFIKPSYSKKSSSPTKMGELMAMGIPLICNNNVGDVEKIMLESKAGFCLDKLNEEIFKNTVSQLDQYEVQPSTIREKAKLYYDLEKGAESYYQVYKEILGI